MSVIDDILEKAKRLSAKERKELIERLAAIPSRARRKSRARRSGPYARSLEAAGTATSDFTDMSENKYKYLPPPTEDE